MLKVRSREIVLFGLKTLHHRYKVLHETCNRPAPLSAPTSAALQLADPVWTLDISQLRTEKLDFVVHSWACGRLLGYSYHSIKFTL